MAGKKGNIGEASIKVSVDTTEAVAGLKKVEQTTEEMATKVESSTDKAGGGFKKMSSSVDTSVVSLSKLVDVATAVVGAAGTVVVAIKEIIKFLESGTKKGEEFIATLSTDSTQAASNMAKLGEELADIDAKIGRLREGNLLDQVLGNTLLFYKLGKLKEERDILEDKQKGAAGQLLAQKLRNAEDEEQLRIAKELAEAEKNRKQFRSDAGNTLAKFWELQRRRVESANDKARMDELEKRRIETEEKAAKKFVETLESEMKALQLGGFGGNIFGDQLSGQLSDISTVINQIRAGMPRRKI